MFLLIAIAFILLYVALVFYIGWSGWGWIKPGASLKIKILYSFTLTVVASSFILGKAFENVILHLIGAYWMALFYLLVILLPLVHLSVWLLRLTRIPKHHVERWSGIMTLFLLFSLVTYGSFNAYSPTIQTYDIHISKNSPSIDQLNIVMASDMHFGLLSSRDHAMRMVYEINALKPDIVLFPGDIVDDEIDQFVIQGIDQILAQINAPYGVYASLGNHDRHNGPMEELIEAIESSNIQVLYDETVTIADQFTLIGRKDRTDRNRATLSSLIEGVDPSKPLILLEHQPYDFDHAQQQGIDLAVSGHTHRGQVFPGNLITSRIYENDWGYLQKEQLHAIVSSGYGFWGPPIRLGSRSEIVQIRVSFGD